MFSAELLDETEYNSLTPEEAEQVRNFHVMHDH